MKQNKIISIALGAALMLSACVIPIPIPAAPGPELPTPVLPRPVEVDVESAVRQAAASQLDLELDAIEIIEMEEVEWPNACLGLPEPGEMCAEVITPGYRVVVEAEGEQYVYRTNLDGSVIRVENGLAMEESEQVAGVVRQMLMQQLQADFDEIEIVEIEEMEWPDGCLGLPATNEMCILMITPGYRIVLEVDGDEYVYRTDQQGLVIRLEAAPETRIGETVIEWTETDDTVICTTARIGTEGVAFGLCGGTLMGGHLAMPERAEDLEEFRSTYASFEADTPAGRLVFTGEGDEEATPAEQRMIAEWARLVNLEAGAGRSGASWGLVFAWNREGGIAGFADHVTVYVTGEVYASDSGNEAPVTLGQTRLDAEQLAQVYAWVDRLASFEFEQADPATADGMTIRIVFSGAGEEEAGEAQIQEIQEFASMLHHELSQ
jgi:hypothetical protein